MPKSISGLAAVLLVASLGGACGEEPPASRAPSAQSLTPAAPSAPAVTPSRGIAPGGLALRPPMTQVEMLERQPDGRYRRTCARPDEGQRAAMERPFRIRREGR
jgi:hypothetical protein